MMDDIDLEFTELELGSDVGNLKLLQKQLNSVQSIRYEQQRKDELITRLKERVHFLETESRSYEDIKEHVLVQSRHVMKIRDQEMREKLSSLHEQMEGLRHKVRTSEEEQERNSSRLAEAKALISKLSSKLTKQKEALEAEKKRSEDLQVALEGCRRTGVEKEAALSLEIHSADKHIQQLKSAIREKHVAMEALRDEHESSSTQLSSKFFEELKAAKEEAARWRRVHEELEQSSREWRQFQESALGHERAAAEQLQRALVQLRDNSDERDRVHSADIAERNAVIEELRQALHGSTGELSKIRNAHAVEMERVVQERDTQITLESGELQKEVGALQVGLCLQKEMKDRVQHSLNHLKSCLRSLALDLSRSLDHGEEAAARGAYQQLCDLFERLLVSGALVDKEEEAGGAKSSQNWEKHVSHMHSYINQHTALVGGTSPGSAPAVSRYGKSLSIDSDFLSVIKSMRELLRHVLHVPSAEAMREITRLVEHAQLLRSDLEQSDMLMISLVNQLMDEGHVNATDLRDNYHAPEGLVHSFNADGELVGEEIKFYSGSKQRAVLHAKLCTGVVEAIRSAKLARNGERRTQDEAESLRHELDILNMKLQIDHRHARNGH